MIEHILENWHLPYTVKKYFLYIVNPLCHCHTGSHPVATSTYILAESLLTSAGQNHDATVLLAITIFEVNFIKQWTLKRQCCDSLGISRYGYTQAAHCKFSIIRRYLQLNCISLQDALVLALYLLQQRSTAGKWLFWLIVALKSKALQEDVAYPLGHFKGKWKPPGTSEKQEKLNFSKPFNLLSQGNFAHFSCINWDQETKKLEDNQDSSFEDGRSFVKPLQNEDSQERCCYPVLSFSLIFLVFLLLGKSNLKIRFICAFKLYLNITRYTFKRSQFLLEVVCFLRFWLHLN